MTKRLPILLLGVLAVRAFAVEPQLPSRTAIANLHHRTIGARNPDPQFRNPDYMAAQFPGARERELLPEMAKATVNLDYESALKHMPPPGPELITSHLLRTRHIDLAMQDALAKGARQLVILGAGYDSRAYRFRDALRVGPWFSRWIFRRPKSTRSVE